MKEIKYSDTDECVVNATCEGNCEHVGCSLTQLQRLNTMKGQGARRNSPQAQVVKTPWIHCTQCNFSSRKKDDVKNHVEKEHISDKSCPFCLVGFHHEAALKRHVEMYHKENTAVVREREPSRQAKRGQCIFFLQQRVCKKGDSCDFSHEKGIRFSSVKVRKLCYNGPSCNWKPRCQYVHLEDGETVPPRAPREDNRTFRQEAREEDRRPLTNDQGFGNPNINVPPPGYSMANFPNLRQQERPSVFQPQGEATARK